MKRAKSSQDQYRSAPSLERSKSKHGSRSGSKSGSRVAAALADDSPYLRPVTSHYGTTDSSSLVWKEFVNASKRRKHLIHKLCTVGQDSGSHTQALKKMMLELRQLTLKIIEDSLEIEYRSQFGEIRRREQGMNALNLQLPPITSFPEMSNNQDILILTEMVDDVNDVFDTPNIRMLLPAEFPSDRNPFLLAKTIDELSTMDIPKPPPGDLDQELHVLELLRYKRSATALLKAESQVLNKLPISLMELQAVFKRMEEDRNAEMLIRIVGTLLLNDRTIYDTSSNDSDLRLLTDSALHITDFQMLKMLNCFRGDNPMRVDVQAAAKQSMKTCSFEYLTDRGSLFLIEWIHSVLSIQNTHPQSPERRNGTGGFRPGSSMYSAQDMVSIAPSEFNLEDMRQMEGIHPPKAANFKLQPINRLTENERGLARDAAAMYSKLPNSPSLREGGAAFEESHLTQPSNFNMSSQQASFQQQLPIPPISSGASVSIASNSSQEQDVSRGSPKKKMTNYELQKRIREEVEHALAAKLKKLHGDGDEDDIASVLEGKTEADAARQMVAIRGGAPRNKGPSDNKKKDCEQFVCERTISWGENNSHKGTLKITYDTLTSYVVARVIRIHDKNSIETCDFNEGDHEVLAYSMFSKLLLQQICGYTLESLLEYPLNNRKRYLEPVFMQLLERITAAEPISGRFYMECDRILYKNNVIINGIQVDIVIVRNLDCNGLVVHVVPMQGKNATSITKVGVDTNAMLIKLQSLDAKKSIENGPITIAIHDKELQVLLVNQRGLLVEAQNKWSSMIAVAEWLASRVVVKRVALVMNDATLSEMKAIGEKDFSASQTRGLDGTNTMSSLFSPSATPLKLMDGRVESPQSGRKSPGTGRDSPGVGSSRGRLKTPVAGKVNSTTASGRAGTPGSTIRPSTTGTAGIGSNTARLVPLQATGGSTLDLVLQASQRSKRSILNVSLNRNIDIVNNVVIQWMQRNVPSVQGMTVSLTATQDLELLVFDIKLIIPHPRVRKAKGIGKANQIEDDDGMIDFEALNKQEEEVEEDSNIPLDALPNIVIPLSCQLTASDLATFGAIECLDEHRTIALSSNTKTPHPSAFVWNILSRMKVTFKGTLDDAYNKQCSADVSSNWAVEYDRVLIRDVKAISGIVMVISASAVGDEIVFESTPTDTAIHKSIAPKILEYHDVVELVQALDLPASHMEYGKRHHLAYRLVDKLKVVTDHDMVRLETYDYPESKMLMISLQAGLNKPDIPLGSIEINEHHTLLELRTIMKYELERESVPKLFRFVYKGAPCAERQEPFRRAWECLPKLIILSKLIKFDQRTGGAKVVEMNPKEEKKAAPTGAMLEKDQRRVNMKLIPVPIPTLCRVTEESSNVYLYHSAAELGLNANDVVRIGNILGRDYMIQPRTKVATKEYPNMICITPAYDLRGECDYDLPYQGNMLVLGEHSQTCRLKPPEDMGYKYSLMDIDKTSDCLVTPGARIMDEREEDEDGNPIKPRYENDTIIDVPPYSAMMPLGVITQPKVAENNLGSVVVGGVTINMGGLSRQGSNLGLSRMSSSTSLGSDSSGLGSPKKKGKEADVHAGVNDYKSDIVLMEERKQTVERLKAAAKCADANIWHHVWIWKCVPPDQDDRPQWRRLYDDGTLPYPYTYQNSNEYIKFFRVKCYYRLMEILCVDSRCPEMAQYRQRVDEMQSMSFDYYINLAYTNMCDWYPQSNKGIEGSKFIKLLSNMKIFPDLKKSGRSAQVDVLFQKEVKALDSGFMDKYLTRVGLEKLLREIGLVRFPPPASAMIGASSGATDGELDVDESISIDGDTVDDSVGTKKSKKKPSSPSKESRSPTRERRGSRGGVNSPPATASKKSASGSRSNTAGVRGQKSISSIVSSKKDSKSVASDSTVVIVNCSTVTKEYVDIAFRKVITDFLMCVPEWTDIAWADAKRSAMDYEAKRYGAATRIQAKFRGGRVHYSFSRMKTNMLHFQCNVRRKIVQLRIKRLIHQYQEDWIFRVRYRAATVIAALIRRFLRRCRHCIIMDRVRQQEVMVQKAKRFRLKKIRAAARKAVIFKETVRVNGVLVLLQIVRMDQRNYSRDFGIIISVYSPDSQTKYDFPIVESLLRLFMQQELKVDVLNAGDLLDRHNLQKVVGSRLIIRKSTRPGQPPRILFSKQALGQRGSKMLVKGRIIGGWEFVCSLYETGAETTVQCYHRLTSRMYICAIGSSEITAWVTEEYKSNCTNEMDMYKIPPLLRAGRETELRTWLINHIIVDTRKGTFKVLFACQKESSRKLQSIITIQSAIRTALTRPKILHLLDELWVKMKMHPDDDENIYYLNKKTGESKWDKPLLLRNSELPTQPYNQWVPVTYEADGAQVVSYANPHTGKFTAYTAAKAVSMLQGVVRAFFTKSFRIPKETFIKVANLIKNAPSEYEKDKRLASVVNMTLVTFLVELKYPETKEYLAEALELSDANPLVARIHALYILVSCEAPIQPNREKAIQLFRDAKHRDPTAAKFALATCIAKFVCYRHPRNHKVLLNLALIEILINENVKNSERIFKRCLAIAPFDEAVLENWKAFRDLFPVDVPTAMYMPASKTMMLNTNKGGKKRSVQGRPAREDPAWVGWLFVEASTDMYFVSSKADQAAAQAYWYNPATGEKRAEDDPPDFDAEWQVRFHRSEFKEERLGLEYYYDPITSSYWQYHRMTNTFQ